MADLWSDDRILNNSDSHSLNTSRRDRGHYHFHTLFWNTVQRGGLFDDLLTRHSAPEQLVATVRLCQRTILEALGLCA